ncbi:nucleoside hydrolase [Hyalangium versicolor]|uniref:nucleoside hydrolase n=1 Tax=Hyalangium versicolor TaxID=2861190 RepID=UPI001CCC8131|nr:nucleoside hydrolase [Hyalangium versicolor]
MPRKLLIDTDPGVDDALALFLALGSPEAEVVGITTTFGNIETGAATLNALYLLEFSGHPEIPVARGARTPVNGACRTPATHVHGENGLGNVLIPAPLTAPLRASAPEFIARTVMDSPGEITLVTLGPLTNLALALELEPRLSTAVAQVVVMGGAFRVQGNISGTAEANIFNDPVAASRVLSQDWPLTLVGLDVTTRVVLTPDHLQRLRQPPHRLGEFIWRITRVYEDFHLRRYGLVGLYAHDPTAIVCVLDPTLFQYEEALVAVTLEGREAGRTVMKPLPPESLRVARHVPKICTDVNAGQVIDFIQRRLAR